MEVEAVQQLIGSLGFPIGVAIYHMVVLNKTIKTQTETLNEIKIIIKERK